MRDLASSRIHPRCYRVATVEEKDKQAEERQDEPRLWRPWRPAWRVLWAVGMVVAVLTAVLTTALLIVNLPPEIWKDLLERRVLTLVALGFSMTAIVVMLAVAGTRRSWTGLQGKTLWDLLQLLIVPIVLSLITIAFAWQQNARQTYIEDRRAKAERELAEQRAQDEALQAYLDQMSRLLIEKDLRAADKDSAVRTLVRARTLTVLAELDDAHQKSVVQFLIESTLVQERTEKVPVISLAGANLRGVAFGDYGGETNLRGADLSAADLRGAIISFANLTNAELIDTKLSGARLEAADLSGANLADANLSDANLDSANFSPFAFLQGADLSRATLIGANLHGANLVSADLVSADLSNADLFELEGITNEELAQQSYSLKGATMPNGQKYEDWIKSRGKDG
jgi:uncharacterized protein YjbI with pentapeptide repeats